MNILNSQITEYLTYCECRKHLGYQLLNKCINIFKHLTGSRE